MKKIPAPSGLSKESEALWDGIMQEYQIADTAGLMLLETLCKLNDEIIECREMIEKEGLTVLNRYDKPKPHPLLDVERRARGQFLQVLKALNLDLEPLKNVGRPGR